MNKAIFAEHVFSLQIEEFVKIEVLKDVVKSIDVDSREVRVVIESCEIDVGDLTRLMILKGLNGKMSMLTKTL